ncbi:MAG: AarF/UbiB family protein [Coriobacteriia bacterium]|nr:AarF/UbiB family protein [Coriobacteriia bacterium]
MASRGLHIAGVAARRSTAAAFQGRFGLTGGAVARNAQARQLRLAFEELGPAWIKLGQLISVRPDLFPAEWIFEMELLRDNVPALPATAIRRVIAQDFGRPPEAIFASFEDVPVASASIAQVHRATLAAEYRPVVGETLPAGTPLAIKVVRPGVEQSVLADIAAARPLVERIARLGAVQRFNLPTLLEEFSASLASECDLRNEARVADRFAFDFRADPLVFVPRVVWPLTSRRVVTMEFADGWRLSDMDDAARRGIDGRALAIHGADVFMRSVLELGRYHADLHPSNVFVTPDSRICYLDFGIVGTTAPSQRESIAQVLAATVYGDPDRALRYSAELGLEVPQSKVAEVRRLVGELMATTLGAPRDVRGFAIGFLRIMNDAGVEIPVGYGLLVKALVTVEGVAQAIYPDIDIMDAAKPYATQLIAQQMMSPARLYARLPGALRAAMRELAG